MKGKVVCAAQLSITTTWLLSSGSAAAVGMPFNIIYVGAKTIN